MASLIKSGVFSRMHQNTATKRLEKVPGHTHLFRRGARYYFRIGVPEKLRPIVGRREITKSLNTADFHKAKERISQQEQTCREILRMAQNQLDAKRKRIGKPKPAEHLLVADEKHALALARKWFLEIERNGAEWWQENRLSISQEDRTEMLIDLWHQKAAITGEAEDRIHESDHDDGKLEVRLFLQAHNLKMNEQSEEFSLLARLFREARLEYVRRQQDRITGKAMKPYSALFRELDERTPILEMPKAMTVKQLTIEFIKAYSQIGKAAKTILQYQITANTLCELFGARAALSIVREDVDKFCTILDTMPRNMVKKYPKMTTEAAIAKAAKAGDTTRLAPNTRRNRFFVAYAMFKYAQEANLIPANPFSDRLLKARFIPKEEATKERPPFTLEELQKIFKAPLYTGCKNDGYHYAHRGPNVIRRARFWVPLIGLFHGMRENEICQLHTADVKEQDGILYFDITKGDDKRLKNKSSARAVPLHPEMEKMGFMDYVAKRRADTTSPRLFPELRAALHSGSYADPFSNWFRAFLKKVFGRKIDAVFHSFRHSFKDYATKAGIPPHRIDRLCGWSGETGRQQRQYGSDKLIPELAVEIARIKFDGLDLSHLYAVPVKSVAQHRVRKRRQPVT